MRRLGRCVLWVDGHLDSDSQFGIKLCDYTVQDSVSVPMMTSTGLMKLNGTGTTSVMVALYIVQLGPMRRSGDGAVAERASDEGKRGSLSLLHTCRKLKWP